MNNLQAKTPMIPLLNLVFFTWFGEITTYPKTWFISFHRSQSAFFFKVILEYILTLHSHFLWLLSLENPEAGVLLYPSFRYSYFYGFKTLIVFLIQLRVCILFIMYTVQFVSILS